MQQATFEKKLENINDLPTFPIVAHNVIRLSQSPKVSALQVGRAISQDTALTSKILKMANSSFYGFPKKITTVQSAVVTLGFANIKNIVLTAAISDIVPSKKVDGYFDRLEFWKHSLACGITTKLLAKRLGLKNTEELFTCGLLHDLGKIILDTYFNDEYSKVVSLVREKRILIRDAEQQILGLDHSEVGGKVANKWNFPPLLIKTIRFHHNPALAHESMRLVAIVHLADVLCRALGMGNGGDSKIPWVQENLWKAFRLNKQRLKNIFSQMEREVAGATDFLLFVK